MQMPAIKSNRGIPPAYDILVKGRPVADDYTSPFSDLDKPIVGRYTREVLEAMVDTLIPRNEKLSFEITHEVANYVERFLAYLPKLLRWALPAGLFLLELGAIFLSRPHRRFSKLSQVEREFYLWGWVESKIPARRDLLKGIKALVMMGYFEHPDVIKAVGYAHQEHLDAVRKYREETYGD